MADTLTITAPWSRFYTFYLDGMIEVREDPSQADFEAAWAYVLRLREVMNRWIGNLMCHADKAEWGGPEYITGLMEATGRSRSSLYQIHSIYKRLIVLVPGVKYSYDREAARLPPEKQRPMLEQVAAGKYTNSTEFGKAVSAEIKAPPRTVYPPPLPIPCPICSENGWNREQLSWYECPNPLCGTHGDELLDQHNRLLAAARELYQTGDRGPLDEFARLYNWT